MPRGRKASIKEKYFIFFLLIGFIPMLIFSFIYLFSTLYGAKTDLEEQALADAGRLASSFDYLVQSMDSAASEFSGYIYGSDDFIAAEDNDSAMENLLSGMLLRYEEILGYSADVFYYGKGDADIFTSGGMMPYKQFEDKYLTTIPVSDVPFFSLANRVSLPVIRMSQGYTFFFYAVPEFSFIPNASLVFMVNQDALAEYMDDSFLDGKILYKYMTKDGRTVFCNIPDDWSADDSCTTFSYISPLTQNRLVCYQQKADFYGPYYKDICIYFISLAILVAVIVLLSYKLAKASYDPIGKLVSRIAGSDTGFAGREIMAIEDEWNQMKAAAGSLEKKVEEQSSVLLDMIFRNLLSGRLNGSREEIEYFLSEARWVLFHKYYQVAVIVFADEDEEKQKFFERMLSDISDHERKFYPVHHWYDDTLIIIAASRDDDVRGNLKAIAELLELSGNKGTRTGCGDITRDIEKLNVSYIEALTVVQECEKGGLALYSDAENHLDRLVITRSDANLFRQAVQNGDSSAAISVMEKQFAMIGTHDSTSITKRNMLYDILNMIIRTANDFGVSSNDAIELYDAGAIDDFHDRTVQYVEKIVEMRRLDLEHAQDTEKNDVIRFVDENFRNTQISLTYLSDRFGKSVSYMSRLFKSASGISFVDYIWNLRLTWIKNELSTTDRLIRDIVNASGYSDISGTMRKFKASEGYTMNQYREMADNRKNG